MDPYWDGSCMDPSYYDNCYNEIEENSVSSNLEDVDPGLKIIQDFSTNPTDIEKFQSLKDVTDEQTLCSVTNYVKLQVFFNILDQYSDVKEICTLDVQILSILLKNSAAKIYDEAFMEFLLSHQNLIIAPLLYYPIHYLGSNRDTTKVIIDICNEILESINFDDSFDETSINQIRYLLLTMYDYSRNTGSINFQRDLEEQFTRIIDNPNETWKPCIGPFYKLLSVISLHEKNFQKSFDYISKYAETDNIDSITQDSIEGALEYIYSYIQNDTINTLNEDDIIQIMDLMLYIRLKLDSQVVLLDIVEFLANKNEIFYESESLMELLIDSFNEADLISETRIYLLMLILENYPRDENWFYMEPQIYDRIILNSDKLETFQNGKILIQRIRAEYKTNIRR